MKSDTLAKKAIIFIFFIGTTTIIYGLTTKLFFTAPNYDDVSMDPEGGSYYDYGSRVAAAVWKGASHWIGISDPTIDRKDMALPSTSTEEPEPEETFEAIAEKEMVSRRRRIRYRRLLSG